MTNDQRLHPRFALEISFLIVRGDASPVLCRSADISAGGVFLWYPDGEVGSFELGESVRASMQNYRPGANGPFVDAQVVRVTPKGFAIQFLEPNHATVDDVVRSKPSY